MLWIVNGRVTHEKPLNEEVEKEIPEVTDEKLFEGEVTGKSYKGYIIHKTKDKNNGVHFEVYKNGVFVSSCDTSDEAVRDIDSGKIDEEVEDDEFNPFDDMIRLEKDDHPDMSCFMDLGGNWYRAPLMGESRPYPFAGYVFAYDFGNRELVVYDGEDLCDSWPVSLASWLDSPDYCVMMYMNMLAIKTRKSSTVSEENIAVASSEIASATGNRNNIFDYFVPANPNSLTGDEVYNCGMFYNAPKSGVTGVMHIDGRAYKYDFGTNEAILVSTDDKEVIRKEVPIATFLDRTSTWLSVIAKEARLLLNIEEESVMCGDSIVK